MPSSAMMNGAGTQPSSKAGKYVCDVPPLAKRTPFTPRLVSAQKSPVRFEPRPSERRTAPAAFGLRLVR